MNRNYKSKEQKRGKGNRVPQNKGAHRKETSIAATEQVSARNDASWYGDTPQLISDAASLAYAIPSGAKYNINGNDTSVPGLMRVMVHPAIGISTHNYSPVNVAARNIYSYVRHANSGHSNYDSPDLMMYLLSMDSIYSMYAFLVRAYGCLRLYTQKNRYYPRAIIEGMYLDPDDFVSHMADFRYYINQMVKKMGSFCVPASMPYFRRHMWMYEGLYVDDTSEKAQTYMFVPDGFYKYNEYDGAGKLEYTSFTGSGVFGYNGLIQYVNQLMEPIFTSEDMNIMSGDILKAYGENGIFKVSGIEEGYIVLPSYNTEVLSQIQNCVVTASLTDDNITQDLTSGAILFNPTLKSEQSSEINAMCTVLARNMLAEDKVLNMYKDQVTPEDTMAATRLTYILNEAIRTDNTITQTFDHVGTEIITGMGYCRFETDGDQWLPCWHDTVGVRYVSSGSSCYIHCCIMLELLAALSNFNYHPELKLITIDKDSSANTIRSYNRYDPIMDLNNFTIVDKNDLYKMHETALLSEFSCPQMGAFNNKYQ